MPLFKSKTQRLFEETWETAYDRFEDICRRRKVPALSGAFIEASVRAGFLGAKGAVELEALRPLWKDAREREALALVKVFTLPSLSYLCHFVQTDNPRVLTHGAKNEVADTLLTVLDDRKKKSRSHFVRIDRQVSHYLATEDKDSSLLPNIVLADAIAALEDRWPNEAWDRFWPKAPITEFDDFVAVMAAGNEDTTPHLNLGDVLRMQLECVSPAFKYAAQELKEIAGGFQRSS